MRTYIRTSEAWYAQANRIGDGHETVDEFILQQGQHGDPDGVPQIELIVRWRKVPGGAHVGVYDESWQAFSLWADLWMRLGDEAAFGGGMAGNYSCGPDDFVEILEACGFEDRTPRENPSGEGMTPQGRREVMVKRLNAVQMWLRGEADGEEDPAQLVADLHWIADEVREPNDAR